MKNLIFIFLVVISSPSFSQVANAEYFIDIDPGIENGESIAVTDDFTIVESIDINTTELEYGFHTLYVRVQDLEGVWSLYDKQLFHLQAPPNDTQISAAEYFIDTDPGINNGTAVTISSDYSILEDVNINTSELEKGFHTMYFRVKDEGGSWSLYDKQLFYVMADPNDSEISDAEYFIDLDPGIGNGISINVTEGFNLDENFQIDTEGLETGFHTLYVRTKDAEAGWALYDKQIFRIQDAGPIVTAEFFVDVDPGEGNAEEISIDSGFNIYEDVDLSTIGLDPGLHTLSIRVKDGNDVWSDVESAEFTIVSIDGVAEFSKSSFVIFPNPTADEVNVKSNFQIQELLVYDTSGNLVKNTTNEMYIDVRDLASGQYILAVITTQGTQHFNFIKE